VVLGADGEFSGSAIFTEPDATQSLVPVVSGMPGDGLAVKRSLRHRAHGCELEALLAGPGAELRNVSVTVTELGAGNRRVRTQN